MQKKVFLALLLLAVLALGTSSCKSNKCNCPKWEMQSGDIDG